jgi:hypothetical protein
LHADHLTPPPQRSGGKGQESATACQAYAVVICAVDVLEDAFYAPFHRPDECCTACVACRCAFRVRTFVTRYLVLIHAEDAIVRTFPRVKGSSSSHGRGFIVRMFHLRLRSIAPKCVPLVRPRISRMRICIPPWHAPLHLIAERMSTRGHADRVLPKYLIHNLLLSRNSTATCRIWRCWRGSCKRHSVARSSHCIFKELVGSCQGLRFLLQKLLQSEQIYCCERM